MEGYDLTQPKRENTIEQAIREWKPLEIILEEGLPEKEVSLLAKVISETLPENMYIRQNNILIEQLEDFFISVLEEYNIIIDESIILDLTSKIISAHNSLC